MLYKNKRAMVPEGGKKELGVKKLPQNPEK